MAARPLTLILESKVFQMLPMCTADDPTEPFNDAYDCLPTDDDRRIVNRAYANFGKAIAAYENKLVSLEAPFDRFVRQGKDSTAISPAAKRGARLFVGKASCIDCHNGPMLTDKGFHNIGIPQVGDHVPTRADCVAGNASCDCETVGKEDTCIPSGAWAGLWKLTLSSNKLRKCVANDAPVAVPGVFHSRSASS